MNVSTTIQAVRVASCLLRKQSRKPSGWLAFLLVASLVCFAQIPLASALSGADPISTLAGTGVQGYSGDGGPATVAQIDAHGVATDSAGNFYIADGNNNRVRRVDVATGVISTVAGTGAAGYSGDGGSATSAQLNWPYDVAVDSANNLYIADASNNRIRKVDALTGVISTVAGTGAAGYSGDGGSATAAQLNRPMSIAFDPTGNLHVVDTNNARIRKIDGSGTISTVAGNGTSGYSGDGGLATVAQVDAQGIAFDSSSNLYIADNISFRVRRVLNSTGIISTVAGTGVQGFSGDGGSATLAKLSEPYAVAVDSDGNLYIGDIGSNRIRRVDTATGIITTVAGTGLPGSSGDGGPATSAQLNTPQDLAFDPFNNLYILDRAAYRVRRITPPKPPTISSVADQTIPMNVALAALPLTVGDLDTSVASLTLSAASSNPTLVPVDNIVFGGSAASRSVTITPATSQSGTALITLTVSDGGLSASASFTLTVSAIQVITTVAGNGTAGFSGDGGLATAAQLGTAYAIAHDSAGNLYIADTFNNRVRRVDRATGLITTVAGTGTAGYNGDGISATTAQIKWPYDIALDGAGNLYIADTGNNRIRRVDATTGLITTVAGNGVAGFSGDGGPASAAQINAPYGVVLDPAGNLYISDQNNQRIRRVDAATGFISTIVGDGTGGYSGDGGPASAARISAPRGLALDSAGNLYIADSSNYRIRRADAATGTISTVAGNGTVSYSGDGGPATDAALYEAYDVAVDASGNLYIPDGVINRIRRVDAATGIITAVVGTATGGYGGDGGPPTSALLSSANSVAVDPFGYLSINDTGNRRVRRVIPAPRMAPTITAVADQTIPLNAALAALPLAVGDVETPAASLTLSAASANPALVPPANIVFGGSGASRSVTITPAAGQTGTAVITLTVSDGEFSTSTSFTLTVTDLQLISTVAGTGVAAFSGDGGLATAASFSETYAVATDSVGNLYISESPAHRIRRVDRATGVITTVAGTGAAGFSGDGGPASAAQLNWPRNIAVDSAGNLYIGDTTTYRVRRVDAATGVITTLAGNGTGGYSGDGGPASAAQLGTLRGLACDSAGNLYIADYGNHRIRRVDAATGIITTVVGTGAAGFSGDSGPATAAQLNSPHSLAFDAAGNLYIGDQGNNRVRRVEAATGIISTLAGSGVAGYSGDGGLASAAQIGAPWGIALGSNGSLYIADVNSHRVRQVDLATGIISTLAGSGVAGSSGDGGPAAVAQLNGPWDVATDGADNLYISEAFGYRVRRVTPSSNTRPTMTPIANQTIALNGSLGPLALTVGDAETAAGSLTLLATSANPALVPVSNIVFGGSGANRTVTITPTADLSGTVALSLIVSDGQLGAVVSFTLTVAQTSAIPCAGSALRALLSSTAAVIELDGTCRYQLSETAGSNGHLLNLFARSNQTINGNGAVIEGSGALGLLAIFDSTNVTLRHLTLTGGRALGGSDTLAGRGGGLLAYSSSVTLDGVQFIDNRATLGGAIATVGGLTTVLNGAFAASEASAGGAAIFAQGPLSVRYSTFAAPVSNPGAAIFAWNTLSVESSIFANYAVGIAAAGGPARLVSEEDNLFAQVGQRYRSYNGSQISVGARSLSAELAAAQFVDLAGHNYQLREDSPALDRAAAPSGLIALDAYGNARPFGNSLADLGAYEFQGDRSIVARKLAPRWAAAASPFTIQLLVANRGRAAVAGLELRDTLPVGFSLVGGLPAGGRQEGSTLIWPLASIDPNQTISLSYQVSAAATTLSDGLVVIQTGDGSVAARGPAVTVEVGSGLVASLSDSAGRMFDPASDGLGFAAWDGPTTAHQLTTILYRLFGPGVCAQGTAGSATTCVLTATAARQSQSLQRLIGSGRTFGVAALSLKLFRGETLADGRRLPSDFQAGAVLAAELPRSLEIEQLIDLYQAARVGAGSQATLASDGTAADLVRVLQADGFTGPGGTEAYTLQLRQPGVGGTSLLPYALERRAESSYWLYVYDPDAPGDGQRVVVLDTEANTWAYSGAGYQGDASSGIIALRSLATDTALPRACGFCAPPASAPALQAGSNVAFTLSGPGAILISDTAGRQIGVNGLGIVTVNSIPGAWVDQVDPGPGIALPPAIYVPAGSPYHVVITATAGTGTGAALSIAAPGMIAELEDLPLSGAGDSLALYIDPSARAIRFSAGTAARSAQKLTLALEAPDGKSYGFTTSGFALPPGATVSMVFDTTTNQLRLSDDATQSLRYDMDLVRVAPGGATQTVQRNDLTSGLGAGATLALDGWDGNDWPATTIIPNRMFLPYILR